MDDQGWQGESAGSDALRTRTLREVLGKRGFHPSSDLADIQAALALGESALGGELVAAATVAACERKTQRCFFILRGAHAGADGFIALLFLNQCGYEALMYGRFQPEAPDLQHLTAPDQPALAIYVWCLAGGSEAAKRAVVRAVTEARRKAFPDIALFARPVSREGRMMTAALDAPGAGAAWLGWIPAGAPTSHRED